MVDPSALIHNNQLLFVFFLLFSYVFVNSRSPIKVIMIDFLGFSDMYDVVVGVGGGFFLGSEKCIVHMTLISIECERDRKKKTKIMKASVIDSVEWKKKLSMLLSNGAA